jgi:hypothetical protein
MGAARALFCFCFLGTLLLEERALSCNGGATVSVGRVREAEDARVYRFSLICIVAVLK